MGELDEVKMLLDCLHLIKDNEIRELLSLAVLN